MHDAAAVLERSDRDVQAVQDLLFFADNGKLSPRGIEDSRLTDVLAEALDNSSELVGPWHVLLAILDRGGESVCSVLKQSLRSGVSIDNLRRLAEGRAKTAARGLAETLCIGAEYAGTRP